MNENKSRNMCNQRYSTWKSDIAVADVSGIESRTFIDWGELFFNVKLCWLQRQSNGTV